MRQRRDTKRQDDAVIVIDDKKYWAHVVEAAQWIRKLNRDAKTPAERARAEAWFKRSCKMYKSLKEVLAYGDRLDDLRI